MKKIYKNTKKNELNSLKYWIFISLWCILLIVFLESSLYSAEKSSGATARVRFANPEARLEKAMLEEQLKTQQCEIESLRSELQALRTENIQKQTEDAQIKEKNSKIMAELKIQQRQFSEENSALRKKLLETLDKYSEKSERIKELEYSVASMIETLDPVHVGQREVELTETLNLIRTSGLKLVSKGKDLIDTIEILIPGFRQKESESAEIKAKIQAFNEEAGAFAALSIPPGSPEGFEKCNVLEVNEKLGLVVLSAGYRNGVRVNMSLHGGEDDGTVLRVISVRPFVSGAVVEQGAIRGLVAGMQVSVTGKK